MIFIGLTIISLFPLLRKDQTLNENEANELKEIIWGKKEIGNNSKKLEIIEMFIDMIDDKIADNVLKTRRSLKAFAGFSAIFVIPLLLEIFSKMKLIDLLIILVLFVPTSYIGIFIVGRDVDTWELILTKKSFEYTNAKKELRFLKEYLKNSDKENSK